MRILFLSRWFPYPANNGSKLRISHLLRELNEHHQVTLLSFFDPSEKYPGTTGEGSLFQKSRLVEWKEFQAGAALPALLSRTPRSLSATYSDEMAALIQTEAQPDRCDLVVASQIGMASYSKLFSGIPSIFEEVELGLVRENFHSRSPGLSRLRHGLTWLKHRRFVARVLGDFRACTVASEDERDLLRAIAPRFDAVEVVPNGVDVAGCRRIRVAPQPDSLIFAGSFRYEVNHEAMVWFLREVYPLLLAEVPNLSLKITGDHANLPLPRAPGVTLTGLVEDVRPLVAGSWVSLAPIQRGGGTRLKILEAMALRTPVVSTSKGAEGLDVEAGRHLLIADTPREFSAATLRILRDPELRTRLITVASERMQEKYDWKSLTPGFLDLAERTAQSVV